MASGGGEEEEGRGSRRRSLRASKGVWTATEESVWLARLQLLPEDDEDRCACWLVVIMARGGGRSRRQG